LAQIFPKQANKLPLVVISLVIVGIAAVVGFFRYYGSPKYLDVGYQPIQPIAYSHKVHAGDLKMDCRYCHSQIEVSPHANVPSTQVCMNCHTLIGSDKPSLKPLFDSWANNIPVKWQRVHKLPDYAYFNHSAHLRAGVACITCHGDVTKEEVITQLKPLSMGWCLDCHRNPDNNLRPVDQITNMNWTPPPDFDQWVKKFKAEKKINPPVQCSGCHR